ncbi:MAG TPA: AAA family ATPase [Acidimicrobiales bacterium]|nr:AAA family ATPase [Acidimicrobiales bacterium]
MTDPADQLVDLAAERGEVALDEVLEALDRDLVGLAPVKARVREIAALLLVDRARRRLGLATEPPTLHMSFTGNPGTGKTTVATRMASVLHRLGYLPTERLVAVTRDDLVGEYIGHTAPKTRAVLDRAMRGVLFIDEAYLLHRPENERDYGQESIEILLQVMEDRRDELVVILAGYGDQMDRFFASNPGMRSRVTHHLDFPDFTPDELLDIADRMLTDGGYRFSDAARATMVDYLARRTARPLFANARSVRNALDRARLRQAGRHVAAGTVTVEALSTIEPDDLLGSRVFEGEPA